MFSTMVIGRITPDSAYYTHGNKCAALKDQDDRWKKIYERFVKYCRSVELIYVMEIEEKRE